MKVLPAGINQNIFYTKEAKKVASKPALNNINQYNNINWHDYFLAHNAVSFSGMDCSTTSFPLKKVYELDCPCCGQVMLTKNQVEAFVTKIGDKTGESLQDELMSKYSYYKQTEKTIVDEIVQTAKQHPDEDLKAIIKRLSIEALSELENAQKEILNDIEYEISLLPENQKQQAQNALNTGKDKINNSNNEKHFKRREFIESFESIKSGDRSDCNKHITKIIKLAEQLPTSHTSKYAFYVKYGRNKSNQEIARRLILPSIVSTEHIEAHSHGGNDNTSNYIPMCRDCNSKREDMPYNKWFEIHPEMPENLQKYLDTVGQLIHEGILGDDEYLDTYVDDVINAVSKATGGKLRLKKKPPVFKTKTSVYNGIIALEKNIERLNERNERLKKDQEFLDIALYVSLQKKASKSGKQTSYKTKFREFQKNITLPKDIDNQIKQKTEVLTEIRRLETLLFQKTSQMSTEEDYIQLLNTMEAEISQIQTRMEQRSSSESLNSDSNNRLVLDYLDSKKRIGLLESVNENVFCSAFKTKDKADCEPLIFLDELKNTEKMRMDNLLNQPAVLQYIDEQNLSDILAKKTKAQNYRMAQITDIEKIKKQLNELKSQQESVKQEIARLNSRKKALEYKFKNAEIEEEIEEKKRQLEELKEQYNKEFSQ